MGSPYNATLYTHRGVSDTVRGWAARMGVPHSTMKRYIRVYGIDHAIERAAQRNGNPYVSKTKLRCESCGRVVERRSNKQRWCRACGVKKNREKARRRYHGASRASIAATIMAAQSGDAVTPDQIKAAARDAVDKVLGVMDKGHD